MRTRLRLFGWLLAGATGVAAFGLPAPAPVLTSRDLAQSGQQRILVDSLIGDSSSHPRLGIPDFPGDAGDAELVEAARTIADVLWADLEFEREFYLIDRQQTASIPVVAEPTALPFDRWSEIGADYVVVAQAARTGSTIEVRLHLVRARGENRGVSSYSKVFSGCTTAAARACAHYIADSMHKDIRYLDGVAQTRFAFVSDREGTRMTGRPIADAPTSKELFIADYDGANVRQVTANRSIVIGPAWSPDARALAYTLWPPGAPPNVFISTLDGRPVQRLVTPAVNEHNTLPAWSPDGTRLAFASNRGGDWDIYVANRDGSGLRNITPNTPRSSENAPTWSPDGLKIAFTSDRSGGNQLYMANAEDGLGLDRLTLGAGSVDRPTWSPLNFIAFTAGTGPGHNISLIDFNIGRTPVVLTDGIGDNQSPTVAPNGRHIAFTTTRWGREEIAIIDRAGQNLRRVTRAGNNSSPSWSRTRR